MKEFGFSTQEKLKSRKAIAALFDIGVNAFSYPLKAFYHVTESSPEHSYHLPKIGVSVGKRKFKHAVDRNLIKRRIKEAYRLNKNDFLEKNQEKNFDILFVYISDTSEEYAQIEKGMIKVLKSISYGSKPK